MDEMMTVEKQKTPPEQMIICSGGAGIADFYPYRFMSLVFLPGSWRRPSASVRCFAGELCLDQMGQLHT